MRKIRTIQSLINILQNLQQKKIDKYDALIKIDRLVNSYKKRNYTEILNLLVKARDLVIKYDYKAYREFRRRFSHKVTRILNPNKKISEFIK